MSYLKIEWPIKEECIGLLIFFLNFSFFSFFPLLLFLLKLFQVHNPLGVTRHWCWQDDLQIKSEGRGQA